MYYKDDVGRMDAFRIRKDAGALPNTGHLACRAHAKLSNEFDMIGRIHADIFFQECYMLNEVGINRSVTDRQTHDDGIYHAASRGKNDLKPA